MRHEIPGLRADPGRGRGDHRIHPPRGEGGRDVAGLDLRRCGAHQLRQPLGRGVVGAKGLPLHVRGRVHGRLGVEALSGPRHRIEQRQPLCGQPLLHRRARSGPERARLRIAVGEEGDRIDPEDRVLVGQPRHQHLADRRQPAAHRVLDLGMGEERARRMHRDGQPAIGRRADILGEPADVLGVEHAVAIGGGHVPVGGGGGHGQRGGDQPGGERAQSFLQHLSLPDPARATAHCRPTPTRARAFVKAACGCARPARASAAGQTHMPTPPVPESSGVNSRSRDLWACAKLPRGSRLGSRHLQHRRA